MMYFCSDGAQTPGLKTVLERYIKTTGLQAGKNAVQIAAFRDANPMKNPWTEQPIYQSIKTCLHKLGYVVQSKQYELFQLEKFDAKKYDELLRSLDGKGTIAVVYGGNTFRLAQAFSVLPALRDYLSRKVRFGKVLYISFSAGTVFAGRSVALARDDKNDVIKEGLKIKYDGLGLVKFALRPHAQSEGSQDAGKWFEAHVQAKQIRDDAGKVIDYCAVRYVKDGEALVMYDGESFLLPDRKGALVARMKKKKTRPLGKLRLKRKDKVKGEKGKMKGKKVKVAKKVFGKKKKTALLGFMRKVVPKAAP